MRSRWTDRTFSRHSSVSKGAFLAAIPSEKKVGSICMGMSAMIRLMALIRRGCFSTARRRR
jgi:hypothetical protein